VKYLRQKSAKDQQRRFSDLVFLRNPPKHTDNNPPFYDARAAIFTDEIRAAPESLVCIAALGSNSSLSLCREVNYKKRTITKVNIF